MSQQIREQISALMDGELSRDETAFLLRRMEHEPALVTSWSRFHRAWPMVALGLGRRHRRIRGSCRAFHHGSGSGHNCGPRAGDKRKRRLRTFGHLRQWRDP